MTQKIIEVVGTSKESFAKAAENAVAEAAKTVRGMKWARVAELEMELDGKKITKYRTTTKIYFEIEKVIRLTEMCSEKATKQWRVAAWQQRPHSGRSTLVLCDSFFSHAFAPTLASRGASRPASGRRSGASRP